MSLPPPPPASTIGPLNVTDFVRYQGASGDMNPIHHDQKFAESAGFPMPFSAGMFQAGLLASWAVTWLGADNIRRYKARFVDLVWPGDVLTCSGSVLAEYEREGERRVDLELLCTRQTGRVAVRGEASFVVPD